LLATSAPYKRETDKLGPSQHQPTFLLTIIMQLLVFEDGAPVLQPTYATSDDEKLLYDGAKSFSRSKRSRIPAMITCGPQGYPGDEHKLEEKAKEEEIDLVIDCAPQNYAEEQKGEGEEEEAAAAEEEEYGSFLSLMESEIHEDNRYGMQRLMQLANSEFVNLKQNGTIAQALICGDYTSHYDCAERLRCVFLSFLSSKVLRLPALRVLASSIELIISLERTKPCDVNFSSRFWRATLETFANNLEDEEVERIEATLSIKCLRLLQTIDPPTINPFIRYSMLPYILNAHHLATIERDRVLQRESTKLLSLFGITPDEY
jgi:hypothetical protein